MNHSGESVVIDQMLLNSGGKVWNRVGTHPKGRSILLIETSFSSLSLLNHLEPDSHPFPYYPDEMDYFNPFDASWNTEIFRLKKEYGYPNIVIEPPHENKILIHLWSNPLTNTGVHSLLQTFHFETRRNNIEAIYSELQHIKTFDLHLKRECNTCMEVLNISTSTGLKLSRPSKIKDKANFNSGGGGPAIQPRPFF